MALRDRFFSLFAGLGVERQPVRPMQEQGTAGFAVHGGFLQSREINEKLRGDERYRTASELMSNLSIVAAGLRYQLNLLAKPAWRVDPAEDQGEGEASDAAKEVAEFIESVMDDLDVSWARLVRRAGLYRYHGFGIHEWQLKRRDDGLFGYQSIEPRPQHTISRWDIDDNGGVIGVVQRSPQTGQELYLPRRKLLYFVDDALTDSPEGFGLFRHLVEPGERMKRYLELEGMGFERDLRGTPIARAPLQELNDLVKAGRIKRADADAMIEGLREFVKMQAKSRDTGMLLDSQMYTDTTGDGERTASAAKWAVELLQGATSGMTEVGAAINRLTEEMARILGVESLLLGGSESGGNRALAEDKSRALALNVNSALGDMAEVMDKDFLEPMMAYNAIPAELRPTLAVEDVSYRSVAEMASTLRDLATAGATLAPDDPAIDDLRDAMGLPRPPEYDPDLAGLPGGPTDPNRPTGDDPEPEGDGAVDE